ncbi:hypothetical protein D3C73_1456570 [compost metagenome]
MPGMRHMEQLIKAAQQLRIRRQYIMREHSEAFVGKSDFANSEMIVQSRLGRPTNMHGRSYVILAPFEDALQLLPVVHVLEFHLLHRRTGDDQSVQTAVCNFIERFVEALQMLG